MPKLNILDRSGHTVVEDPVEVKRQTTEKLAEGFFVYANFPETKERKQVLGWDGEELSLADELFVVAPYAGG